MKAMLRWLRLLSLGAACIAGIAGAAPSALLLDPAPVVQADSGAAVLMLKLEELDAASLADTTMPGQLRELGADATPSVEVERVEEVLPVVGSARVWRVSLRAKGMPDTGQVARWLIVPLGQTNQWLPYKLTSAPATKFNWVLGGTPNVALEPGQSIPVSIAAGVLGAREIKATLSTLVEKSSRKALAPEGFMLCREAASQCTSPVTLAANESAQLWLHGAQGVGQFEGSVTLASLQNPEGEKINMNVWVTSLQHRLWGVGVVLLGVLLNFGVTVVVRNRISRNQLLMPAAVLEETVRKLKLAADQIVLPDGMDKAPVVQKIESQLKSLDIPALEKAGLPTPIVPPWSSATSSVESYRRYVQGISDWVAALQVVASEGLAGISKRAPRAAKLEMIDKLKDAFDLVSELAGGTAAPALDAVHKGVKDALAQYDQRLPVNESLVQGFSEPPTGAPKSVEDLRVETGMLSAAGWIFLMIATTLAGAYVLVFSPIAAGFGSSMDYLLCLAWGIGLPAAGQLAQATTSTISTSFGVARP